MQKLKAIIMGLLTCFILLALAFPLGNLPALAPLLDPYSGAMANAESIHVDQDAFIKHLPLTATVSVSFDDRLVPHIKAGNNHDLYFTQGYIHARFRLWQMDMETRAAAGRISEVVGASALKYDRGQRRKGMIYAAENSLQASEADPLSKQMLDAYTNGVNAYINQLNAARLPLEYKLMGFKPEPWTNLRTVLLLKFMADDLTGETDDLEYTCYRDVMSREDFDFFFPDKIPGSLPVIPKASTFNKASLQVPNIPNDSVWAHYTPNQFAPEQHIEGKGSNNWAISGSRTASGAAILCNDPHLGLNLPSLWFEVQLNAPGINCYGVSLPGCPGIVLGFNDSISWGFTNNSRDVKDFYAVHCVPGKEAYYLGGKELPFIQRPEIIKIKGKKDVVDTVRYTIQGPIMYDSSFKPKAGLNIPLAMSWMAHRPSNEVLAVYLLNRAVNYSSFVNAIMYYTCPAQNMLFADRLGNIALWGQGQFINKWKEQGRFIMNGADTTALWNDFIPMRENPHVFNPSQGYLCSANQNVTDTSYPYYYNGMFAEFRAWRINHRLEKLNKATLGDMFNLQNDTYSELAERALPPILKQLKNTNRYSSFLEHWDYRLNADSKAATVFQVWWYFLYNELCSSLTHVVLKDNAGIANNFPFRPSSEVLLYLIENDTYINKYLNATNSTQTNFQSLVNSSFKQASDSLDRLMRQGGEDALTWYKVKNTSITHLAKLPAFSYSSLCIGGWGNTVNAAKDNHGPSWRMVVQMGAEIQAYGIYPGGQSGNPGSAYYANFINNWAEGKYYKLMFLQGKHINDVLSFTWSLSN